MSYPFDTNMPIRKLKSDGTAIKVTTNLSGNNWYVSS
mgnify:CR=1 FL=1